MTTPSLPYGAQLLFICGDQSGIGKSSVAMGVLSSLLSSGYHPSELAYIKPATQCEDIQLVCKYCEQQGIAHQGLGPIIFYEGFTAECIDNTAADTVEQRHEKIKAAVTNISQNKKLVIVDGVGYPAVGSVCGISNADVAKLLHAPVLVVGRPGVGNAIDSMNYILTFFNAHHVTVLGGVWNKLPSISSYHSYEKCKTYVTKYYHEHRPEVGIYGFIPLLKDENEENKKKGTDAETEEVSCRLRTPKTALKFIDENEERKCKQIVENVQQHFDITALIRDLNHYYEQLVI